MTSLQKREAYPSTFRETSAEFPKRNRIAERWMMPFARMRKPPDMNPAACIVRLANAENLRARITVAVAIEIRARARIVGAIALRAIGGILLRLR